MIYLQNCAKYLEMFFVDCKMGYAERFYVVFVLIAVTDELFRGLESEIWYGDRCRHY
jgi:hypothetical protein